MDLLLKMTMNSITHLKAQEQSIKHNAILAKEEHRKLLDIQERIAEKQLFLDKLLVHNVLFN